MMGRAISILIVLFTVAGCASKETCPQTIDASDPSAGLHASAEVTLREQDHPAIAPRIVEEDAIAEHCRSVVVQVGKQHVELLGFYPDIYKVQKNTAEDEVWVALYANCRQSSYLILKFDGRTVYGYELGDDESPILPSIISFEEIKEKFGSEMIQMKPNKIYVEEIFYHSIKRHMNRVPGRFVLVPGQEFDQPHFYTDIVNNRIPTTTPSQRK